MEVHYSGFIKPFRLNNEFTCATVGMDGKNRCELSINLYCQGISECIAVFRKIVHILLPIKKDIYVYYT